MASNSSQRLKMEVAAVAVAAETMVVLMNKAHRGFRRRGVQDITGTAFDVVQYQTSP